MKKFCKYIIVALLALSSNLSANEHKSDLIVYTDNINNQFLDLDKKKSIEIITYFDTLISKMYGYEEVELIKEIKQKFTEKYIKRAHYIDESNRNLRAIFDNRRNKKILKYEEEINNNKILLK